MKQIVIRKPRSEEYEIWALVYQVYLDFYQTSLTENELRKVWSWIFEDGNQNMNCYFAEVDNEVVGLAHFREFIRPIKACKGIFLDDLIVMPKFRGHRIGYSLIEAIKLYAKEKDIPIVRWITGHNNSEAMKLYDAVATKTAWITYDASV